jgi:hypothetical protein
LYCKASKIVGSVGKQTAQPYPKKPIKSRKKKFDLIWRVLTFVHSANCWKALFKDEVKSVLRMRYVTALWCKNYPNFALFRHIF